jgi:hypothetical protein
MCKHIILDGIIIILVVIIIIICYDYLLSLLTYLVLFSIILIITFIHSRIYIMILEGDYSEALLTLARQQGVLHRCSQFVFIVRLVCSVLCLVHSVCTSVYGNKSLKKSLQ